MFRVRAALTAAMIGIMAFGAGARAQEAEKAATATFAGGCFWCVEADFDKVPGVLSTVSGYTGGTVADPSYKQVSAGGTGHREAVQITYDPSQVSYEELLNVFWRTVDPTDAGGQFCDRGKSYETAIFVENDEQRRIAEESKAAADAALDGDIVTPIEDAGPFYPAEDYHQDYYHKSPLQYKYYRWSCGRNARVEEVWGVEAYRGIPGHG